MQGGDASAVFGLSGSSPGLAHRYLGKALAEGSGFGVFVTEDHASRRFWRSRSHQILSGSAAAPTK